MWPAEGHRDTEALRLTAGDVGAGVARRAQKRQRQRLGHRRDQERPLRVGGLGGSGELLDDAEEVRLLEDHRGGVAIDEISRQAPSVRPRLGES